MIHHRHSFFPLVLAGLTLALIIFMFYSFTGWQPSTSTMVPEQMPVSPAEYEQSLTQVTRAFVESYPGQSDDLARLVLVEKTMQQLLNLRVPAEQKELHLSLVIELNQIQQALRERNGEAQAAFEKFVDLISL